MTLGDILKRYRQENKISMDDFAKSSGLSKGYISMFEKNKNPHTGKPITPSLATIKSVAGSVGIDLNDILHMMNDNQEISLMDDTEHTNIEPNPIDIAPIHTIAAHHDGEWTEEELAEIESFKEYVKTKRAKQEGK